MHFLFTPTNSMEPPNAISTTRISDCPPGILVTIASYLRSTHYRSVATSFKALSDAYLEGDEPIPRTTSMAVVASSTSYTRTFCNDIFKHPDGNNLNCKRMYWYHIAEKGHSTTLLWALGMEQLRCFEVELYSTGRKRTRKEDSRNDVMIVNKAIKGGKAKNLQLLLEDGFWCTKNSCRLATQQNQLECLRVLEEYGCPSTCTLAERNHLCYGHF